LRLQKKLLALQLTLPKMLLVLLRTLLVPPLVLQSTPPKMLPKTLLAPLRMLLVPLQTPPKTLLARQWMPPKTLSRSPNRFHAIVPLAGRIERPLRWPFSFVLPLN
jgi:hypothetical protein